MKTFLQYILEKKKRRKKKKRGGSRKGFIYYPRYAYPYYGAGIFPAFTGDSGAGAGDGGGGGGDGGG